MSSVFPLHGRVLRCDATMTHSRRKGCHRCSHTGGCFCSLIGHAIYLFLRDSTSGSKDLPCLISLFPRRGNETKAQPLDLLERVGSFAHLRSGARLNLHFCCAFRKANKSVNSLVESKVAYPSGINEVGTLLRAPTSSRGMRTFWFSPCISTMVSRVDST